VSGVDGDDADDGLTAEMAFLTLGKAYTEALADPAHKRIVVLSDLINTGAVTFDTAVDADGTILIEGNAGGWKIERSDGANESVIEITNGAKIIFKNITINGMINPSANTETSNNRALKITGAGTAVTLQDGVVVTGKKIGSGAGKPTDADGSGVLVSGGVFVYGESSSTRSKLVMTGGAVISGNTASGPSVVYGGGVFCSNGDITMTNAQIKGNFAIGTGGSSGIYGGGVYCHKGTMTMNSGAVVSGNTAKDGMSSRGGGVFMSGLGPATTLTMNDNALISGNTAKNSTAYGGGVYIYDATLEMNDSAKISKNNSIGTFIFAYGGGVYIKGSLHIVGGTLTMKDNAVISGNTATAENTSYGGGVSQDVETTFNMPGGTITADNNATVGRAYYYDNESFVNTTRPNLAYEVNTAIIAGQAQ
jgi:hypothetical protein